MGHRCGVDDGPGVDPGMTGASEPWDGRLTVSQRGNKLFDLRDEGAGPDEMMTRLSGIPEAMSAPVKNDW
ncbi:hypothetical protein QQF64_014180 [Cirrhinus molitorella]|uniref:Uncharacterized protein n=1 Tax=Cirrhinus molitorella TaxID=172907 RepID=A0ABR3LWH1_9TELE